METNTKSLHDVQMLMEEYKLKYEEEVKKNNIPSVSSGSSEEVSLLQAEVTKWMQSAQQLEQLGTEAVQEVYAELERERQSKADVASKYEEERSRREKAEEELQISEHKLQQLDGVMQKLMNIKK